MKPGDTFGNYLVINTLGAGGQGSVGLACNLKTAEHAHREFKELAHTVNKDGKEAALLRFLLLRNQFLNLEKGFVAIKKLGANQLSALDRLRSELKILQKIEHSNIVTVIEEHLDQGWYAMEYCPGGSLWNAAAKLKGDPIAALKFIRPVVDALAAMHHDGLLHRDIKPENIVLDAQGRPKLADFGLAIAIDDLENRLTVTNESVGTKHWKPEWMFGERVKEEDLTGRIDNFAIGKILYCLIAGRRYLRLWYHRKPENDLELIFPNNPKMALINELLDGCIVEDQQDAHWPDAKGLLNAIDAFIGNDQASVQGLPVTRLGRLCRICGSGSYIQMRPACANNGHTTELSKRLNTSGPRGINVFGLNEVAGLKVFRCDSCGHIEYFHVNHGNQLPEAWQRLES